MAEIITESQLEQHKAKNFFVPSGAEVVLYMLFGAILLFLFNSGTLLKLFKNNIGSASNLNLDINILNSSISNSFSTAFGGRLGQIVVWSFVGAAAYIALWFLKNLLNSFENDIIIDHYLHPSNYSRAGFWGSAFAGKIFFGVILILFVSYTYLSLKTVLPAAAALAASAVYHFKTVNSLVYILICILISMTLIYFWVLIARLTAHLWKQL